MRAPHRRCNARVTSPASAPLARAAHAIRRLVQANPLLGLVGEQLAPTLALAEQAPEQLPLGDRFGIGRILEEMADDAPDPELRALGDEIIDDVLTIGSTHAAEASILLQDVPEPERTVRYLRLLKSRLDASPAPPAAPVDAALAAGMREALRHYLLTAYPHASGA